MLVPKLVLANISDATVYAFLANHPNGSQLVHEDLEQIHEDNIEYMDLKWLLALLSMRTIRLYFQPLNLDLSYSGLEEFQQPELKGYEPKTSNSDDEDISNVVRESPDVPLSRSCVQMIKPKVVNAARPNSTVVNVVRANQTSRILMEDMLPLGEELKERKLLVKELLKLVSLILRLCTLSRRHLQLADADGISSLPTMEIFEQLSLMGNLWFLQPKSPTFSDPLEEGPSMRRGEPCGGSSRCQDTILGDRPAQTKFERLSKQSNNIRLSRVNILGSGEDSMTLQELMVYCTTLSKKLESLETDLKQTKQIYGAAYTRLIKSFYSEKEFSTAKKLASYNLLVQQLLTILVIVRIAMVHEAASSFNVEEWEDIQARVQANEELMQRAYQSEKESPSCIYIEGNRHLYAGREEYPLSRGTLTLMLRNKPDLDTMSFDNLYNNIKIVEQVVKRTASSSSQNMDFVSSPSSTNEVNTAYRVSTTNTQVSPASTQVSIASTQHEAKNVFPKETGRQESLIKGLISPLNLDLSYSGLEEFQQPELKGYEPKTSNSDDEDISNGVRESPDAPLVEELVSDDKLEKKTIFLLPRGNQRNWNNQKSQQLGSDFVMYNKACFADYYCSKLKKAHPSAHKNMVPKEVLMKTGLRPLNTTRPKAVNTARPNSAVVNVVRANQDFDEICYFGGKEPKRGKILVKELFKLRIGSGVSQCQRTPYRGQTSSTLGKRESLETNLKQAKKIYGAAYTRLIKKGRRIAENDQDPSISLVQHDVEIQGSFPTVWCTQLLLSIVAVLSTVILQEIYSSYADEIYYAETDVYIVEECKLKPKRIAMVHEAASSFNVEEWEDIQARVQADEELVQRLQVEEREKYTKADQARMLAELINQRKRFTLKHEKVLEDHQEFWKHTEVHQFFDDMLKAFDKDDLVMLWNLVKEKFNSTKPTDEKEREIWKLYDSCGVHHVSTEKGIDNSDGLDGENLDKMKEKDACIFVGYSTMSRAYKVYNKRTRLIVKTIHVNFDELPLMASDHVSSDPVPQSETVTTSNELDLLFSLMFEEYFTGSTTVVSKSSAVTTADASYKRQQQPDLALSTLTLATTVTADGNFDL
ncbi:hypothetical protein Tco_0429567 [Tanacetum coccineum]